MLASYPSASINNLLEAARTAALVDALQQLAVEAGCTRLDLWRSEDGSFISVSLQHSRVTPVTSKLRMDTRSNHVDRASSSQRFTALILRTMVTTLESPCVTSKHNPRTPCYPGL